MTSPTPPAGPASTDLGAVVRRATTTLMSAGVPDPAVDAQLIVGHVLGLSRGAVQAAALRGDAADDASRSRIDELVARRAAREPLQHLTGRAPFRHLELEVGPGVFVPRPETELIAQLAVDALLSCPSPAPVGVDLGTGSGAIALAMATEVRHARIWAVERSDRAHAWARRNIEASGIGNLQLRHGDFADALAELDGTVDVIASNPPYVPDAAIPRDPEVRAYDPPQALYAGADGLDDIRTLAVTGRRLARSGAVIVLEHGEWQGEAVRAILSEHGWRLAATHPDLTMRDRATTAVAE